MNKIELFNSNFPDATKHLSNQSIDLIVTDPPYGVNFKQTFYDDSTEYVLDNVNHWFHEMFRLLKQNSLLYMFVGVMQIHNFIQAGIDAGFEYKNILAVRNFNNGSKRAKNNFSFNFQPVLVFSKGKARNLNNVDAIPTSDGWYNDKRNKNPNRFTYEYSNWFKTDWFYATAKRAKGSLHPNEKNVDFIKFLIEISSDEDNVILDPFMGSGTTGVSAAKAKRNFIGVESDTSYYNIAKERIDKVNESNARSA